MHTFPPLKLSRLFALVTVLVPEYIPAHWWEQALHSQTALRLKAALLLRPNTIVTSVPYHGKN